MKAKQRIWSRPMASCRPRSPLSRLRHQPLCWSATVTKQEHLSLCPMRIEHRRHELTLSLIRRFNPKRVGLVIVPRDINQSTPWSRRPGVEIIAQCFRKATYGLIRSNQVTKTLFGTIVLRVKSSGMHISCNTTAATGSGRVHMNVLAASTVAPSASIRPTSPRTGRNV